MKAEALPVTMDMGRGHGSKRRSAFPASAAGCSLRGLPGKAPEDAPSESHLSIRTQSHPIAAPVACELAYPFFSISPALDSQP